ncbi:hypothetical protein CFC21_046515 [Triticum aestivum]|uniref:Uncharacterized protein n=4 Tax=Triticinae TaxID=1648030 RepID=A0A9R1JZW7_WHEAT|nr:aquaporin NIP1-2 [Aegilops tauschii subsp. strangulata]XP_044354500.1 aquaporin NIP1-2-like [Triticum aestivum]KAF7035692.1 hypothetical protein CFC21_046515 [Triticum aestivum]
MLSSTEPEQEGEVGRYRAQRIGQCTTNLTTPEPWKKGGTGRRPSLRVQRTGARICVVWGLVVMVMVYSVGHVSGAHFNPAVTIAFAACRRFPWKQVPSYVLAQVLGSTLASLTLRLTFGGAHGHLSGMTPSGSSTQGVALEFIISFYLMFVVSGVATDDRAVGDLAGLAVGATVVLNVLFAGPITGASMNPARSLGPAIVACRYGGVWVYVVGPVCGTVAGAWTYNLIWLPYKPIARSGSTASFLRPL